MEGHLTEFLVGELILLLVATLLAVVSYFLKRHINTTDDKWEKVASKLNEQNTAITRLLERDRQSRLSDYKKPNGENGG